MRGGEAHWARKSAIDEPYVIGLTGGIAAGKSTARKALVELGAGDVEAVDCDVLAHQAYTPGSPTFAAVVHEFGSGVVGRDGSIDRKALGALVFADDGGAAMARLNAIVWPATAELAAAAIRSSSAPVVVMEAAVLLEAGWDDLVDEVWVISAPHAEVLSRLASRNGLSAEAAEARVAKQMSAEQRVARAHVALSSAFGVTESAVQLRTALEGAHRRRRLTLESAADGSVARAFAEACAAAGVADAPRRRWWAALRDAYGGSGRFYHTMGHIAAMLRRVTRLEEKGLLREPVLVRFAVLFHDAVYDPKAKDNEVRSADLWREFATGAGATLSLEEVERVGGYIERTAQHMDGPASGDLAHFLDADLATLGLDAAAYAEYARHVRLEYAHVPAGDFAKGRSKVLSSFLNAPSLYFTKEAAAELEDAARSNLEAEIARLAARVP
jgi:dephospho-CoA kinase